MPRRFAEIAFTPAVQEAQRRNGAGALAAHMLADPDDGDALDENSALFLATRDHFFLATISETGWPYVQHRGGPPGFVRVLDPKTFAFADFRGNRQYVSIGNLADNDRAALIFMDYPRRARLKIHARLEAIENDPEFIASLMPANYSAKPERAIKARIESLSWNCPQHITPRFTEGEVQEGLRPMLEKLHALEAENRALRARLDGV